MLRRLNTFVHHGSIVGGKLVLDSPGYFKTIIAGFEDTKDVRITVQRKKRTKTNSQLGYLFGVVYAELSRHTGHSVEELDSIFKAKYLKRSLKWRGADLVTINSKANLTSDEMGQYINEVIGEANELGIEIPSPDKHWDLEDTLKP